MSSLSSPVFIPSLTFFFRAISASTASCASTNNGAGATQRQCEKEQDEEEQEDDDDDDDDDEEEESRTGVNHGSLQPGHHAPQPSRIINHPPTTHLP